MCGVPHHAIEGYVAKLLRGGRKVVICDQVEDPAQAKGLVRREVTRILTPGTLAETALLESKEENFLAVLLGETAAVALALLDVSTGAFFVRRCRDVGEALAELEAMRPRELLCDLEALPEPIAGWARREGVCLTPLAGRLEPAGPAAERLQRRFGTATLRGFGLTPEEPAVRAAAAALAYAEENQLAELRHVRELVVREARDRLTVDATTLANLEVFRRAGDGAAEGTLLALVDRTRTAAGGRAVRAWLRSPLRDAAAIGERHDAVAALVDDAGRRDRLRHDLARFADLERLATRAVLGTLTPRESGALRDALVAVPALQHELEAAPAALLARAAAVDPLAALASTLVARLAAEPPAAIDAGGAIAAGIDPALDEARSLASDSKRHIVALEARERERTGIGSLKIRYNRVFGYSIEISRANAAKVPAEYQRRQTLVNAERYVTPEIQELEARILGAEERQMALERELFAALRSEIAGEVEGLRRLASAFAAVDVVAGWADLAARHGYCRPEIATAGSGIRVEEGRHPVVERQLGDRFVPNDTALDAEREQIVVLTGPNMGGKSTYLRQVALIVLLAQAGSFVPARAASIGLVDRVFSRVGASDDLARGESTFMVEMIETANILRFASAESLVILDEVGRGTATFDGLSLAWAIVEHLHESVRPLTLFATHYHELTELAELLPRVVNRTMAVKEWEERILFLRRVVAGSADKSYGLHVARLAGLPGEVVQRAEQVLRNLEAKEFDPSGRPRLAEGARFESERPAQMPLFTPAEEIVAKVLRDADLDRLTPLAALNLLVSLQERLK
jgi:DNA mismatch repair protein MutS